MKTTNEAAPGDGTPWPLPSDTSKAHQARAYDYLSHLASELLNQETTTGLTNSWNSRAQQQVTSRSREQVARFFSGTDLIEPGLVLMEEWRPEPGTAQPGKSGGAWGAVGRKG